MSYTVSAINMLNIALLRHKQGVSIGFVRRFSEIAKEQLQDCNFDVTARDIYAVLEECSAFKYSEHDNNIIIFSKEPDYTKEIKTLEYTMPPLVLNVLLNCNIDSLIKD